LPPCQVPDHRGTEDREASGRDMKRAAPSLKPGAGQRPGLVGTSRLRCTGLIDSKKEAHATPVIGELSREVLGGVP
jgi:hypothetical protein